jgi:Fe-S oxidoreductase
LLNRLGYHINIVSNTESGRAKISKGFLNQAKTLAKKNVETFEGIINKNVPLVGIEPSAIYCFRDEYPELLRGEQQEKARELSNFVFTIEEFISQEFEAGRIKSDGFIADKRTVKYHGHCQQKALTGVSDGIKMLSIPEGYKVKEIKSGCCGMAGSFGYEKEHFDLSMKIGEMVLFPSVRNSESDEIIAAPGTSCRHHIKDGTGKQAKHPVEVLFDALINK